MRINSPKPTQASRQNGAKSKGVKSPSGKNRVRLNALKDGSFSKDIVIESVGERKEDFERLKKEMWDLFQPKSALEEMLVADIVENWWRRQRVRGAESADLKNRVRTGDRSWEAVFFNIQDTPAVFPGRNDFEHKAENEWPMFIHAHLRQRWKRRNILGWESWSEETGGNGRQSFDCGDESGVIY